MAVSCEDCNGAGHRPVGDHIKDLNSNSNINVAQTCRRCGGSGKMPKAVPVSQLFALMGITPKGSVLEDMFHENEPDVKWNGNFFDPYI